MISILPLRKNSKRIKNKNKSKINKFYLYEFILNELLESKQIKKIIISTDYKIKHTSKKIIVHRRPKKLCSNCNMNLVIDDILKKFNGDSFIQVHATNPCLKSSTLDRAIAYYYNKKNSVDSIFSVNEFKKRLWDSNIKPYNHKFNEAPTTQNLSKLYEENSCFYIFSRSSFYKKFNRIGKKPGIFKTSLIESIDIDNKEDLELVKLIKKNKGY